MNFEAAGGISARAVKDILIEEVSLNIIFLHLFKILWTENAISVARLKMHLVINL